MPQCQSVIKLCRINVSFNEIAVVKKWFEHSLYFRRKERERET